MSVSAKTKFQTIWPQYMDSRLTPELGRRVSKKQGVPDPNPGEIQRALVQLGFADAFVEPAMSYPGAQSQWYCIPAQRGCVKVSIKAPASEHYIKKSEFDTKTRASRVEGLDSKHQVLVRVAEIIKELPDRRPQPLGVFLHMAPPPAAAAAAAAGGGGGGKKGRK